ncbi:hypothetical protein MCPGFBBE_00229 [Streptococcus equi subsp. zooepidemicus]|nr:hypothetical protein MCPGFBBE_00229 [Streptococcus equi subsp. zooepidemicus]
MTGWVKRAKTKRTAAALIFGPSQQLSAMTTNHRIGLLVVCRLKSMILKRVMTMITGIISLTSSTLQADNIQHCVIMYTAILLIKRDTKTVPHVLSSYQKDNAFALLCQPIFTDRVTNHIRRTPKKHKVVPIGSCFLPVPHK